MKKVSYFLGNIIIMVVSFILYSFVQPLYFYPRKIMQKYHFSINIYMIIVVIITVLVLTLLAYFYRGQLKIKNNWRYNISPHWDLHRLLIAIIGFILLIGVNIVIPILLGINEHTASANQMELNEISKKSGVYFELMVVIVAPFFEEIIFRGMLFNTFFENESILNKWLGIILSGFAFSCAHNALFSKFLFLYWALGSILAWIYVMTKDLRYSVLVHALYNFLGFI